VSRKDTANEGCQTPELGNRNSAASFAYDWEDDGDNVRWALRSASDSVVEQQSQLLNGCSTPVRKSLSAGEFTTADSWVVESTDTDSDADRDYQNALEDELGDTAVETIVGSRPTVDYDVEKKFK
jgi:hypothetical protein